ncbi:MAG: hypothetical protein ACRD0C_12305 [Acidimicrobiia bacterium]
MARPIRSFRAPVLLILVTVFSLTSPMRIFSASVGAEEYAPQIDPADFTTEITNPLFPLRPGTRWVYEGPDEAGDIEHKEVEVTAETRQVMGVDCVIVHDQVSMDGELVEDTWDWYAQDKDGNVWYFGEDTSEYEGGKRVSTDGSWEAGKEGAYPGIVMEADPKVGDQYRQEYYEGEAEDMAEVLSVDEHVTVPQGSHDGVLKTKDWNPLEPGITEHKYYAPGVGTVFEEVVEGESGHLELLEMTEGTVGTEAAPPPEEDDDDGDDEDDEDAAGAPAAYAYAGVLASSSRSRTLAGSTRTPGPMVEASVTALM